MTLCCALSRLLELCSCRFFSSGLCGAVNACLLSPSDFLLECPCRANAFHGVDTPGRARLLMRAISLFCGAGGFCEGVRLAGFSIAAAVDADRDACRTHRANFPEVALFEGDVGEFLVKPRDGVPGATALRSDGVDLVFGGPPCQGFSQIGPRSPDDPRNELYKEFARVVETLQPRAFAMENVPNVLAMDDGRFKRLILARFAKAGYSRTAVFDLVASAFGVPQQRRRVFFVGVRDGLALPRDPDEIYRKALDEYRSERCITVHQALSDLPAKVSLDDGPLPYPSRRGRYSDFQRMMRLDCDTRLLNAALKTARLGGRIELHNHHTKGMEERRKKIVALIRPGMTGSNLPASLWRGIRSHKWRRLHPGRPSYTILAQMSRDLSEWIHPTENRWITVREAARLQSFHDGFVFHGSEYQQLKQVGNAVPPLLGFAVAGALKRILSPPRKA